MSVRYIFNSDGAYVAFIQGESVFSPDADWIGFIRNGSDVYATDGNYMGKLLNDDRIARNTAMSAPPRVYPPFKPLKPFRPFSPFPRLRMPPLPWGWVDVFEDGPLGTLSRQEKSALQKLEGSELIGGDGAFLGVVSKNRLDPRSIGNQIGNYGSRYSSSSIFNPYSPYGNRYSQLSPFNRYSNSPPVFKKGGRILGHLTINQYVQDRIDPEKFFVWFEQL